MTAHRSHPLRHGGRLTFAAAIAAGSLAVMASQAVAQQKPLKKVHIVAATPVLDVTYSQIMLPLSLGWYRQDGYDVEVSTTGGSLQAAQQLVAGNAEFGAGSASAFIQTYAKSNLPVQVALSYSASDWSLGVDANGPIKSVKDLKGKTIGVVSLATGGMAFLNGFLRKNGLEPGKDVDIIAVGIGAPAVAAMKAGTIHGLMYWGSAIAGFENAGLNLRKIVGDDWHTYPEYSLAMMKGLADKDPEMAVAIARNSVKAMVFAFANPECTIRIHWSKYPSTKPSGVDDATAMKWDKHSLETQLASLADAHRQFADDKLWGKFDPAAWDRLIKFMVETKQLEKAIPAASLTATIPDFYAKTNAFDIKAVQESAKACKF